MSENLKGSCYCKKVQFEVKKSAKPMSGHCHCTDCRTWTSCAFFTACILKPGDLVYTKGEEYIKTIKNKVQRNFCGECGTRLHNEIPDKFLSIPLALLSNEFIKDNKPIPSKLKPNFHIYYKERMLNVCDGKPKLHDLPKQGGGTGKIMWFSWISEWVPTLLAVGLSGYVAYDKYLKFKF